MKSEPESEIPSSCFQPTVTCWCWLLCPLKPALTSASPLCSFLCFPLQEPVSTHAIYEEPLADFKVIYLWGPLLTLLKTLSHHPLCPVLFPVANSHESWLSLNITANSFKMWGAFLFKCHSAALNHDNGRVWVESKTPCDWLQLLRWK